MRGGLGQLPAAVDSGANRGLAAGDRVSTAVQRTVLSDDEAGPAGFGLPGESDTGYAVHLDDGRTLYARALVLATPAYVSGALVSAFAPDLARMLGAIRYVSTATVSLGYRAADVHHPLKGFGLVIPRTRRPADIGLYLELDQVQSPRSEGRRSVALLRGRAGPRGTGRSQRRGTDGARAARAAGASWASRQQPLVDASYRWRKANPQYDVGHLERMKALRALCAQQPGLFVAGGAFDGVGVPDCVRQGKAAAQGAMALPGRRSTALPGSRPWPVQPSRLANSVLSDSARVGWAKTASLRTV